MERSEGSGDVHDRSGTYEVSEETILYEWEHLRGESRKEIQRKEIDKRDAEKGGRYYDEQRKFFVTASQKGI